MHSAVQHNPLQAGQIQNKDEVLKNINHDRASRSGM
jgi:hypothetical protein